MSIGWGVCVRPRLNVWGGTYSHCLALELSYVAFTYFEIPIPFYFFLGKSCIFLFYLLYLMTSRYFWVKGKIPMFFGVLPPSQIPWSQLGCKWCHGALVEAPDPHGMPTSTTNIYKVFGNIDSLTAMVAYLRPPFYELLKKINFSTNFCPLSQPRVTPASWALWL